ncbi:MAG: Mur ligase family protein [Patescibacteria group bacterium]
MRKIIQKILRFLARRTLKRYQPQVVGITGSVGKTSTKEAVYTVLSSEFRVRKNYKNYNNELGVPLTIIDADTGGKNPFKWLVVFLKGLSLIILPKKKNYPEILILEMGADKLGDIKYLTEFVKCQVGVVTAVAPVHTEFLGDLDSVAREKQTLAKSLSSDGAAILNIDDSMVAKMIDGLKCRVLTYGFSDNALVRAYEETIAGQNVSRPEGIKSISGVTFKISYQGSTVPVFLPAILGHHSIMSALAAVAVGTVFKINLIRIAENLKQYKSPPGRMNLIDGIKYTLIIDDTYNSSPIAALAALEVLGKIQLPSPHKKYAVLGDMLELGTYADKGHLEVGRKVAELGIDYLVTVGSLSKQTANAAKGAGLSTDQVYSFDKAEEAGKFLQERIDQGDLILVKGSQGVRMEKVVKELMAEPLRAEELLVRQTGQWRNR